MSKYLDLAKKLKALAERGIGGEKTNAELQLKKLMEKHKISIDDIEEEKLSFHHFIVKPDYRHLFYQVVATVIGKGSQFYSDRSKRNAIVLKINNADAVEIHAKYDFFLKVYLKEHDIFFTAFVHANDLYPVSAGTVSRSDISEEERIRLQKAAMMAAGMDKHSFMKQITN